MITCTVFTAMEFRDFLCARYNVTPLNFQSNCVGCGTTFDVRQALSCSKGGMLIERHNGLHDKFLYLDLQAFTSA